MKTETANILTLNGGSSSLKFGLYKTADTPVRLISRKIDRIGLDYSTFTFSGENGEKRDLLKIETSDHQAAANSLMNWLEKQKQYASVKAVGHRIVHGMAHTMPERITPDLLDELHRIVPCDPDHLPNEIALIETISQRHPKLTQIACFDTMFHSSMPRVAKLLPIPRRFDREGIQRYGFHGLSYTYLMEELTRVAGTKAAQGSVILAHLGSGASIAAVYKGKSIDTSMGFTPTSGLTMGTRPGDLDPGVAGYIMRSDNLTPEQFNSLINHQCGLLGISETSSDMQDLLNNQTTDVRAAEAVELFCYQTKKWIGAFAAVLGGVDTLIFSGGIGENAPEIRSRICKELGFLGIEIDENLNKTNTPVISKVGGNITVRVIPTDEEWMIAKIVNQKMTSYNK